MLNSPEAKSQALLGKVTANSVLLRGRANAKYSDVERKLSWLWARELGLNEIDVTESPFAWGGDSLTALRIAQSIEKELNVRVSMVDLFRYETVSELGAFLAPRMLGSNSEVSTS